MTTKTTATTTVTPTERGPLVEAASSNNLQQVTQLLNTTIPTAQLNYALLEACKKVEPSLPIIQLLVSKGADFNSLVTIDLKPSSSTATATTLNDEDRIVTSTPLHKLCYYCQSVQVFNWVLSQSYRDTTSTFLLTRGRRRNTSGITPFHAMFMRLSNRHTPVHNLGPEIETADYVAQYYTAQSRLIHHVVNLMDHSIEDINVRDLNGRTVIHYLVNSMSINSNGSLSDKYAPVNYVRPLLNFLIERGADLNMRDDEGNSPLLSLIQATPGRHALENKGAVLTLKALLMSGADITLPDYHGNTPLLISLKLKSFKVASILLEQIRNSYNNDLASSRQTSRMLLSMKYMSYTNNDSVGSILHHLLYEYGNDCSVEAIKLLIDAGINVSQDSELGTPVFMAAWNGNLQFLKTLVEYGHENGILNNGTVDGTVNNVTVGSSTPNSKGANGKSSKNMEAPKKKSSGFRFTSKRKSSKDTSDTNSNDTSTASVMDDEYSSRGNNNNNNFIGLDGEPTMSAEAARMSIYEIVNAHSTVNDSIRAYFGGIEDCLAPVERATPLHAAIARGHTKIIHYLISMGADVKAEAMINTQYRSSAQRASFSIVEILRDAMARGIVSESDSILILDELQEREPEYMRTICDQYPLKDKRRSLLEGGARNHEKKMAEWNGRLF